MTASPPPKPVANTAAAQAAPAPATNSAPTRRPARKDKGDVHVGTMAGDVRRVPGSGTENGEKAIADYMRDVLERVRRSIRERNNSRRR
ncbi:MAG TPA: hypothetical protein VGJ86_22480 [Acidimicrobiales bacterium]